MSARREIATEITVEREAVGAVVIQAHYLSGGNGLTTANLLLAAYIEAAAGGLGMTDDQMMRSLRDSLRKGAAGPARKDLARRKAAAAMGPAKGSA